MSMLWVCSARVLRASMTCSLCADVIVTGGVGITHFAKSAVWGQDLYEDLVEPYYEKGFMWETWRRKPYTGKLRKH